MVLVNYKETNLAKSQLASGISAAQTTINLKAGEGDLFPSVFPFILKLEQYDNTSTLENKPVLKREIVRCDNRVGDILTVTRGFEACPASDTATTQTSTAFAFDADDYIYHVETAGTQKDLKDELIRLNTDKLDITDYIAGTKLFAESNTGNDNYEATINGITSYAQIDGQALRIRVDVGNTADATLNINGLGAKDIVKFQGYPLQTGDVKDGQIIFVIYNATSDDFEIKDSVDQSTSVIVEKFQKEVILGEDVTAGDGKGLVFYGTGIEDTLNVNQSSGGEDVIVGNGVSIKAREKIPVPSASTFANIMRKKFLSIKKNGNPTDNLTFKFLESDGTTEIVSLATRPGSSLTTSFDIINLFTTPVAGDVRDDNLCSNSNSTTVESGIRFTADVNSQLKAVSGYWQYGGTVIFKLYNETDGDILIWSGTSDTARKDNEDLSISNILLEAGKTYRFTLDNVGGFGEAYYAARTYPSVKDNITIVSGYIGGSIDNANGYGIWSITTQEVTSAGISEAGLSAYEGQDIYLEIARDGAQNASDYYVLDGVNGGDTVETRDGANWNNVTNNLKSETQRGFNYEKNKVWLFDARYNASNKADGIVIESGVAGESKKFIFEGYLQQNSVTIGDIYYGNNSIELIGTENIDTDSNSYSSTGIIGRQYYLTKNEYIRQIEYNVQNTYSVAHWVTVSILLNGAVISSRDTYLGAGASTVEIVQIDRYSIIGDIYQIRIDTSDTRVSNINTYHQEYEGGRGEFNTNKLNNHSQFIVGYGVGTTKLELMINEQNFNIGTLENPTDPEGLYYFKNDGIKSSNSTGYIKVKEVKINHTGTYNVLFDMLSSNGDTSYGRIFVNGVAVGIERATSSTSYVTFSEVMSFVKGDLVQLYIRRVGNLHNTVVRNFRARYSLIERQLSGKIIL